MKPNLTQPNAHEAQHLMRELTQGERLIGVRMSPMGGAAPTAIYSLASAAGFMETPSAEELDDPYSREPIGYIDPEALVRWIRGVFGDEELASAVREEIDTGRAYAFIAPAIQSLLLMRVQQCSVLLGAAFM